MKRTAIISAALCLALMASGCSYNQGTTTSTPAETTTEETVVTKPSEEVTSEPEITEEEITEAETSIESSSEVSTASHVVKVEVITLKSYKNGPNKLTSVVPRITVDGKEATELNKLLLDHMQEKYPFNVDDNHNDGMSTEIEWGVKDNILSIIVHASSTSEDYFTKEALNFDLDTLKPLNSGEVTKRLGMTDEEFFGKVEDIVKEYCKLNEKSYSAYDYEESAALINYDKVTPFIWPDGSYGVVITLVYSEQTQFYGSECMRISKL